MAIITPRPCDCLSAATATALNKLRGPSALSDVDGLMDPVSTTGLLLFTVRERKNAVSSIVSVPCVITTPSTPDMASISFTFLDNTSQCEESISCEDTLKTCSPLTRATVFTSGTASINCSTPIREGL